MNSMRFIIMFIAILALSQAMNARTIFVVNAADSGRGTFRDAVENVEDGDVIRFQVAQVVLQSRIEFNFNGVDLNIDVVGPVTINGANKTKLIDIVDGNVDFKDINFINGFSGEGSGGAFSVESNNKVISFTNCKFINNKSAFAGGAIDGENNNYTVTDCLFQNNTSEINGGAINTESGAWVVENTKFINNKVLGGFESEDDNPGELVPAFGGAFGDNDGGTHSFTNCLFQGNQSDLDGGAIDVRAGGELTIEFCTFNANRANKGDGGAIFNEFTTVTILTSTFVNNFAKENGGAIFNENDETAANIDLIEDCFFNQNISQNFGGAINNVSTIVAIQRSLFLRNQANEVVGQGGAIFNGPGAVITSLNNSTLTTNTAVNGGGGILDNGGTINIDSCTIVANNGVIRGGGIALSPNSAVTVINTIVALNAGGATRDVSGNNFNTGNNNLIGDGTGGNFVNGENGNQVGNANARINPLIAGLANNGGFTQTHAIAANSPAVNAGDTTLEDDGRTFARPAGGVDDIGAFEVGATPSLLASIVPEENDDLETQVVKNANITYGPEGITLNWTNNDDEDVVGFNIYNRIQKIEPECKKVSPLLIMAQPGKAMYSFVDSNVMANFRYFYRIQYVKNNGTTYFSPPIKIFTETASK